MPFAQRPNMISSGEGRLRNVSFEFSYYSINFFGRENAINELFNIFA